MAEKDLDGVLFSPIFLFNGLVFFCKQSIRVDVACVLYKTFQRSDLDGISRKAMAFLLSKSDG